MIFPSSLNLQNRLPLNNGLAEQDQILKSKGTIKVFFWYDYFYLDTTYMKCMFTSNFTVTKPNSFIKLILNMPNTNHNLGTQIRMKFPNSPRCGMRTFFKESPSLADTKICLSLSTYM